MTAITINISRGTGAFTVHIDLQHITIKIICVIITSHKNGVNT